MTGMQPVLNGCIVLQTISVHQPRPRPTVPRGHRCIRPQGSGFEPRVLPGSGCLRTLTSASGVPIPAGVLLGSPGAQGGSVGGSGDSSPPPPHTAHTRVPPRLRRRREPRTRRSGRAGCGWRGQTDAERRTARSRERLPAGHPTSGPRPGWPHHNGWATVKRRCRRALWFASSFRKSPGEPRGDPRGEPGAAGRCMAAGPPDPAPAGPPRTFLHGQGAGPGREATPTAPSQRRN